MATRKLKDPKPFTGWTVLYWISGFFGVIFIANIIFIWLALGSFPGLEVDSAYKAGQTYGNDIVQARAQADLGWTVTISLDRASDGVATLSVETLNSDGVLLTGLKGEAILKHPTTTEADKPVDLSETEDGRLRGRADDLAAGNWILDLVITDQSGNRFKSRNKVFLRQE